MRFLCCFLSCFCSQNRKADLEASLLVGNTKGYYSYRDIYDACEKGRLEIVKACLEDELLHESLDAMKRDTLKRTARQYKHDKLVEYLENFENACAEQVAMLKTHAVLEKRQTSSTTGWSFSSTTLRQSPRHQDQETAQPK